MTEEDAFKKQEYLMWEHLKDLIREEGRLCLGRTQMTTKNLFPGGSYVTSLPDMKVHQVQGSQPDFSKVTIYNAPWPDDLRFSENLANVNTRTSVPDVDFYTHRTRELANMVDQKNDEIAELKKELKSLECRNAALLNQQDYFGRRVIDLMKEVEHLKGVEKTLAASLSACENELQAEPENDLVVLTARLDMLQAHLVNVEVKTEGRFENLEDRINSLSLCDDED